MFLNVHIKKNLKKINDRKKLTTLSMASLLLIPTASYLLSIPVNADTVYNELQLFNLQK